MSEKNGFLERLQEHSKETNGFLERLREHSKKNPEFREWMYGRAFERDFLEKLSDESLRGLLKFVFPPHQGVYFEDYPREKAIEALTHGAKYDFYKDLPPGSVS